MITPQTYIEQIAARFELTPMELTGSARTPKHVRARKIAVYLLREVYGLSYPEIGALLGYADHTTARYHNLQVRADQDLLRRARQMLPATRYRRVTLWRPL